MSKITLSLFILLLLTSCATSKFDFATAYKFNTVKRYPTLGEKSLKVLASPEEVLPNHLSMSESKIIETASLKSIAVTSEDIIHSKLSTYKGLDNMSKKEIKRNSKLNKIISRLSDIKFDTIITESGLVIPLIEKEIQEAVKGDQMKNYLKKEFSWMQLPSLRDIISSLVLYGLIGILVVVLFAFLFGGLSDFF